MSVKFILTEYFQCAEKKICTNLKKKTDSSKDCVFVNKMLGDSYAGTKPAGARQNYRQAFQVQTKQNES